MRWQRIRIALLVGAAALTASSARASDCCTPCAPACRTIQTVECVPETYKCMWTAYRTECKQVPYTCYRCECVPETRTRTSR